jgi:hypothetical protein
LCFAAIVTRTTIARQSTNYVVLSHTWFTNDAKEASFHLTLTLLI